MPIFHRQHIGTRQKPPILKQAVFNFISIIIYGNKSLKNMGTRSKSQHLVPIFENAKKARQYLTFLGVGEYMGTRNA